MMKIELTDSEVQTVLAALDNYGDLMETMFQESKLPADEQEMGLAEFCWQKVYRQSVDQFNNSVADAIGEGEQPNNTASASVDPFTLPARSNYENMK